MTWSTPSPPTVAEPKRILIAGDTHGNTSWWLDHVIPQAKKFDCDGILQLGDFGVWPGAGGVRYLDALDGALTEAGLWCWFIDGNHEDFEQLLAIPVADHGRRVVRDTIHHLPRGHRWTWGGRTFVACGGAASIDKDFRKEGVNWWPQELTTGADADACIAGGSADVLVSHDAPLDFRPGPSGSGRSMWERIPQRLKDVIIQSRSHLQSVVDGCTPLLVLHGHWHKTHVDVVERKDGTTYTVLGLTCDEKASGDVNGHCAVLTIDALAADPVTAVEIID